VAIVAACFLVTAVQGVWLRHGMETGWADTAVDAKVRAALAGHPTLLAVLVWPGEPVAVTAMAAAVVLACVLGRRYGEAAFVAISVPLAVAITELVLKPLIGRTSWGDPFPSGHVTGVAALATALTVLLARTPTRASRPLCLALACTAFLITAAVALGVIGANMHHLSDTVGGAAVGIGTVVLIALVLDTLSHKWRRHHDRPLTAMTQDRGTLQAVGDGNGYAGYRRLSALSAPRSSLCPGESARRVRRVFSSCAMLRLRRTLRVSA
jgi:membrane-associated phospholipid phosphatase